MDDSGQDKVRPGTMNRHGVIAYNAAFNGSSAELWNTIPQQSWDSLMDLSLIHISEPTRPVCSSRMPSSA